MKDGAIESDIFLAATYKYCTVKAFAVPALTTEAYCEAPSSSATQFR
jgi:hypothetical protein